MICNLCKSDAFKPVWTLPSPFVDSSVDVLRKRPFRRTAEILDRRFIDKPKRLLEIGSAYGGFLEECSALGWEAEGVDLSEYAAKGAVKRGQNVQCGDFRTIKLGRSDYDAVVTLATLEHVPNPKEFLVDAAKLVAPGGVLMLTTIDMSGLMPRLLGQRWAQVAPPRHLYYFQQKQLARYLENAGLKPIYCGGKVCPATQIYRVKPYRPNRNVWNVGYTLFVARKEPNTESSKCAI